MKNEFRDAMTVRCLINHLLILPPDAPVIFNRHSEFAELHAEDIAVIPKEKKEIAFRPQQGYLRYNEGYFKGEEPVFKTVVVLPGN